MPLSYVALNRRACLAFALAGAWALSSLAVAEDAKPKAEPAPVVIDPSQPSPAILKQRPPGGLIFTNANIKPAHDAAVGNRYLLIAIDPETGKWATVLDAGALRSSVSRDGQMVAYELGKSLWTRSVAGNDEPKKIVDLAGPGNGGIPVWSLDGKRLLMSLGDRDPLQQRLVYLHLQFNADGTNVTELPLPKNFIIHDGTADGRKLLGVSHLNTQPARWEISLLQPDGSALGSLTDADTAGALPRTPRFSPDGRRVLYCDNTGTWVVDSDGKNRRKVWSADGKYAGIPCWSPDGARFAIVTRPMTSQTRPLPYTLEIIALDDLHRVARFQLPAGSTGGFTYWR